MSCLPPWLALTQLAGQSPPPVRVDLQSQGHDLPRLPTRAGAVPAKQGYAPTLDPPSTIIETLTVF